jgi:hypothetical protein
VNIGSRHSKLCGWQQGRWPRREEARFPDHEVIVVELPALKNPGRDAQQEYVLYD